MKRTLGLFALLSLALFGASRAQPQLNVLDHHQQPNIDDGHMSDDDLYRAVGRGFCDLPNSGGAERVVWRNGQRVARTPAASRYPPATSSSARQHYSPARTRS